MRRLHPEHKAGPPWRSCCVSELEFRAKLGFFKPVKRIWLRHSDPLSFSSLPGTREPLSYETVCLKSVE